MSVESVQGNIQPSEQYTIRAKRQAQSATQSQESLQAAQNQNAANESRPAEIDTYDKDSPAGVKAEGVYSISHDDSGNLRVDYAPKSEDSETTPTSSESSSGLKSEQPKSAGTSQTSSSDDDDELEKLQRQKNEIQQQLNREQNEDVKAALRVQLQNIEAQIIQLKAN